MLEVVSNNVSAIKLYETFGFEREGLLKQNYFANNQYFNVELMALFKEKYKSSHSSRGLRGLSSAKKHPLNLNPW